MTSGYTHSLIFTALLELSPEFRNLEVEAAYTYTNECQATYEGKTTEWEHVEQYLEEHPVPAE